jgi:hypothetical protein
MSEQTVFLPDVQYHVEKILEEVAKKGVDELELTVKIPIGNKRYVLWLRVKPV